MKIIKILKIKTAILGIAMMLLCGLASTPSQAAQVSFDFFYSDLSPHGSWYASAEYGQVWRPNVADVNWNPYYDGHWVYTDLGWTWVSDYDWGSVPYHYGTWVQEAGLGWVWVPGYVWAPAWVVFRSGPDYIGWAPVAPQFSVGFSAGYSAPVAGSFVFVSAGDFLAPRMRTYVIPERQTTVILNRTRVENTLVVENNVVVNRGPDPHLIERASGHSVRPVRIEQVQGVVSEARFNRSDLRVDPERMRAGVRASEPVSNDQPMPGARGRDFDKSSPQPGHGPGGMNPKARPGGAPPAPGMSPNAPKGQAAPPAPPAVSPNGKQGQGSQPAPPAMSPNGKQGQAAPAAKQDAGKKGKKPPKKKKDGNREAEPGKEQSQ